MSKSCPKSAHIYALMSLGFLLFAGYLLFQVRAGERRMQALLRANTIA
jgi:hypothetical protein